MVKSEKHIANGLAAIICGQNWRDGKAYRLPLFLTELNAAGDPAEHLADPWGIGQAHWAYRYMRAEWLHDPGGELKGLKVLVEWGNGLDDR
jgi:hypothetical protein